MPGPALRSRKRSQDDDAVSPPHEPGLAAASNRAADAAAAVGDVYALEHGELMHSTSRSSAGKRAWLRFLPCLERQDGYTYVSCDGSSSGWHACVVAVGEELHLRARWADMQVRLQCTAAAAPAPGNPIPYAPAGHPQRRR